MAEPHFGDPDDLPRTLRRERDAREAARQAQAQSHGVQGYAEAGHGAGSPQDYATAANDMNGSYGLGFGGTVTRFDVPFGHLVWFFIKSVLAAIPALILLTVLTFAGGKVLQAFFPGLRLFEIVVRTPLPPSAAEVGKGPTVAPVIPVAPAKK